VVVSPELPEVIKAGILAMVKQPRVNRVLSFGTVEGKARSIGPAMMT
jgi:hypothetical protein